MPAAKKSSAVGRDLNCDLLVVGTGLAGLVTSLRGLDLGKKVVTIDKLPRGWWTPGGNMIISGFKIHLSFTSLGAPQAEIAKAINKATDSMIPKDMLDVTVKNAGRALKWLKEKGGEFEEPEGQEIVIKPQMPSRIWGRHKPGAIHDAGKYGAKQLALKLESGIKDNGGKILYETKEIKLLTNDNGGVIGATVQDKDGRYNVNAKAVILCSGGYERNSEMLLKYVGPRADEVISHTGPGCTGDAFRMCEELGACLRSMNHAAFSHFYSSDTLRNDDLLGALLEKTGGQGIIVNRDGDRFVDESLGERVVGSLMTKTTIFKKAWIVIDSSIYAKTPEVKKEIEDVRAFNGTVYTASTIEELARMAGLGSRLSLTVSEYNQAVDEAKTSQLRVPRTKKINRIATPPFYAIPFVPAFPATYGGFVVTPQAQVVDWDKKPIPGLYAAGLTMEGSLSGGAENTEGGYVGCLGACLIFGLLAAENAG